MPEPFRRTLALVLTSIAVAPALAAQDAQAETSSPTEISSFSYTSVGLSIFQWDIDGVSDEAFGFGLNGRYAFAPQWYGLAEIATAEADVGGGDLELDRYELGVGYHMPVASKTDLFAEFALVRFETDFPGGDDEDGGWSLGAGVRHWLAEQLEVDASLARIDLDDADFALGLGGQYYVTERLSVGASLELFDDFDTLSLDLKYYF